MRTVIDRPTALRVAAAATAALGASTVPLVVRSAAATGPGAVEPGAGRWRTWFLTSGADLRPPPPYRWNELATELSFHGVFGTSSSPAVYPRIQAYLNTAIHDATVAAWDAKYTYTRMGAPRRIQRARPTRGARATGPARCGRPHQRAPSRLRTPMAAFQPPAMGRRRPA